MGISRPPKGVILALDTASPIQAMEWVERFIAHTPYFKVGLELFIAAGPEIVRALAAKGANVFLDLKLYDIPHTVEKTCQVIARLGAWMCTVHASGGEAMLKAARAGLNQAATPPLLVAVTVLTSMPRTARTEIDVIERAQLAERSACDGVVASGMEAVAIRAKLGEGPVIVTPGIRLAGQTKDDQARTMTPAEAFRAGATFIVMGRGVVESANPERTLEEAISACRLNP